MPILVLRDERQGGPIKGFRIYLLHGVTSIWYYYRRWKINLAFTHFAREELKFFRALVGSHQKNRKVKFLDIITLCEGVAFIA